MPGSSNIVNNYDTTPWRYCHVCFSEALHLDCGGRSETKELRFTLCDQSLFQLSPIFASKWRMEGMHFLEGDKWSPSTNLFAIVRLTHARCQSVRLFNTTVARALDLAVCTSFAALNGGLSTVGGNHGLRRGNSGKIEMVCRLGCDDWGCYANCVIFRLHGIHSGEAFDSYHRASSTSSLHLFALRVDKRADGRHTIVQLGLKTSTFMDDG
jgi:hypothetical protein